MSSQSPHLKTGKRVSSWAERTLPRIDNRGFVGAIAEYFAIRIEFSNLRGMSSNIRIGFEQTLGEPKLAINELDPLDLFPPGAYKRVER